MTKNDPLLTGRGRWGLSVTTARVEGTLVVALAGRLAAADAARVKAILNDAGRNDSRIVLDLQDLDYISSAGILVLQSVSERLRGHGGTLELRHVHAAVRAVLDVARTEF